MHDEPIPPASLSEIERQARSLGFDAACDRRVGALLRTLASTIPTGAILELGTGPGSSTAWLLDGMGPDASMLSVELEPGPASVARSVLGHDPRLTLRVADGSDVLRELQGERFDLIFADTWPGKYWDLDLALDLLGVGGIYVIDDMNPQPNWPDGHDTRVEELLDELDRRPELRVTRMNWSTGVVLAVRTY